MISRFFQKLTVGVESEKLQKCHDCLPKISDDDFVIVDELPSGKGISQPIPGDVPPLYSHIVREFCVISPMLR